MFVTLHHLRNPGTPRESYTEIVPDASRKQLQRAIRGRVALEAASTRTAGEATTGWWTWAKAFPGASW